VIGVNGIMSVMERTAEPREKEKIRMEVEIENFGPISSGKINIRPLTVFIGPNNSGKSYTAMLIHSIFKSISSYTSPFEILYELRFRQDFQSTELIKELVEIIKRSIKDLEEKGECEIPRRLIDIMKEVFKYICETKLGSEITRSFACPLKELIKVGETSSTLRVGFGSHSIDLLLSDEGLKLIEYPQLDLKVKIKAGERPSVPARMIREKNEVLIEVVRGLPPSLLEDLILRAYIFYLLGDISALCYYLPAARSGILQGHKALVASIVRKIPYVGIERLEIPTFSGVVADFLSSIITLPREKGPLYQLAQELENELLKGEILIRTPEGKYSYPEISYGFQKAEIPLYRASSSVSELAPLLLYLKYYIEPRSVLIIEEPEAHLHPENQRILAKFLVRLVRSGVYVIITTHSDYLLEQLNNFILLSKIEPEKRKQHGYQENDFLKPDEVAVYVFYYDKDSSGHKIKEAKVTEEDGILQEEFLRIDEALYKETVRISRELG
jgi:predicted ATPase